MSDTIADIIRQDQKLTGERATWDSWWDALMEHFLPARAYRSKNPQAGPTTTRFDRIYDTTGIESAEGLAAQLTAQLNPAGEQWASYSAPPPFKDDEEINSWYRESSKTVLDYMLHSNFYTERSETFLDKAALGTGCLFLRKGKRSLFQFKHIDLGTFNFTEDEDGRPDRIWRKITLTASQIQGLFPGVPLGAKIQKSLSDPSRKYTDKHDILHYVAPNEDHDPNKLEAKYKPLVSLYIAIEDKMELSRSGFDAFPYEISRMLKWSSYDQWGLAPGRKAMPAMHQANWLEHLNDLAAELSVRPRSLVMADQVGQINLRAGGRTVVTAEAANAQLPREWMTGSRYDIGKDRLVDKQDAIRRMFFQPLFQALANIDHQMTAFEVGRREREQLNLFAPTFSRHEADSQPLHARAFGIALEAGVLTPPPAKLLRETGPDIPDPIARSESRIARMLREHQTQDYAEFMEIIGQSAALDPSVVDVIDFKAALRELGMSRNLPEGVIRTEREVIEISTARAQQQAQAEAIEQAKTGAEAAATASQINPQALAQGISQIAG